MLKVESLVALSFLLIVGLGSCYAQTPNDVTIKAAMIDGSLKNITLLFDNQSKVCPDNDCEIKLEETTFNGTGHDKLLVGILKVEDKSNSDPNFNSFNYYKLAGSFHLSSSKENVKTGQKFLFYNGTLGIDQDDVIFNPEFKFISEIKLAQNNFELNGISSQRSEVNEVIKKLTLPVQGNASALGDAKAKITLVEFADYQCQSCAQFHNETSSQIINDYVNPERIMDNYKKQGL